MLIALDNPTPGQQTLAAYLRARLDALPATSQSAPSKVPATAIPGTIPGTDSGACNSHSVREDQQQDDQRWRRTWTKQLLLALRALHGLGIAHGKAIIPG
jgi:hypothetical protein